MSLILVIDDRATNRDFFSSLLGYRGHTVATAADGEQGLLQARTQRPDLIICDVLMPVMDGYEFVRQLRADPELADIEVAFCSAYFHEHEAHRLAQQCGVRHVLSKPCDPEEVLALIDDLLRERQPAPPPVNSDVFLREHGRVLAGRLVTTMDDLELAQSALSGVIELNLTLAGQSDSQVMLQVLCDGARELLQARFAIASLSGGSHFSPSLHASSGLDSGFRPQLSSAHGQASPKLRPTAIGATPAERALHAVDPGVPEFESAVRVPIHSPDRHYGWLLVADPAPARAAPEDALRWLGTLSAHAGRIHENHCLYARAQRHADQLQNEVATRTGMQRRIELQYAIARVFVESETFEQATRRLLRALSDRLDYPQAAIREVDPHNNRLRLLDSLTNSESPAMLEPGQAIAGRCWVENRPVWSLHTIDDPDQARLGTELAFPVCLHERVIGVVELGCADARPPSLELLDSLGAVGSQIAQFLERRSQHGQILRLNRIHAVLSGINSTIVRVHDRARLLETACRIAVGEGHFEVAAILLGDSEGKLRPTACCVAETSGLRGAGQASPFDALPARLVDLAVGERNSVCSNDLRSDPRLSSEACEVALAAGLRGFAALPLKNGERVLGVLGLLSREPGVFNSGEVALLEELAEDISFALQTIDTRETLSFLERFDPLTGLSNRTGFLDRLRSLLATARRESQALALICFDIKRFRHVNEAFGRSLGDQMLKEFARRLGRHWPDPANTARISNDVFAAALALPADTNEVVRQLLRWPGRDIGGPFELNGHALVASSRSGIALFPSDAEDPEVLLEKASEALRNAKLSGQQHVFFETAMSARLSESLLLESRLRMALERREFRLHYQPKLDLRSGALTGVEALLRWQDPERGAISPERFVPVLEETGLILEVGDWAMQQALHELHRSRARSERQTRVAVNVSPLQLSHPEFVRMVQSLLRPYGSGDAGLDIEITESVIMEQVEENVEKLTALRALGVRSSIDDFGTGYSSLAYLARLPVDALKIDRSFVDTMRRSRESEAIVSTTISLAHSLGLRVVAEGVETQRQAEMLAEFDCDEIQGYWVAAPQPAPSLRRWQRGTLDPRRRR